MDGNAFMFRHCRVERAGGDGSPEEYAVGFCDDMAAQCFKIILAELDVLQ